MKYISNSREYQDLFVLAVLGGKRNGRYLEVGAAHPITDNNTYLLEHMFGWSGASIEWNAHLALMFNTTRRNPCYCQDARTVDYDNILSRISTDHHIDYLQLDVDPPDVTFDVLKKINFNKYSFSIITYEHDAWRGSVHERNESRRILTSLGYTLVLSDVMHDEYIFEDWYVSEPHMPDDTWKLFMGHQIKMNPAGISEEMKSSLSVLIDKL
jgi:hypothetical protein